MNRVIFKLINILALMLMLFSGKNPANASQVAEKYGTLIVDVTWQDNTPANSIYVEAHGYVIKYQATKSFVLKLSHDGEYTASLPPGIYDVFVSESSSWPRCRRIVINSGLSTSWQLKLEIDDAHMGNAAGNPIVKH